MYAHWMFQVASISRKSVLLFSFCKHFDEFREIDATWNIQCAGSRRATIAKETILETSESCRTTKKKNQSATRNISYFFSRLKKSVTTCVCSSWSLTFVEHCTLHSNGLWKTKVVIFFRFYVVLVCGLRSGFWRRKSCHWIHILVCYWFGIQTIRSTLLSSKGLPNFLISNNF